jgi:hypothetical protein
MQTVAGHAVHQSEAELFAEGDHSVRVVKAAVTASQAR